MSRITAYTALAAPDPADELVIVDVSDTTQDPTGTTKNITSSAFFAAGAVSIPLWQYLAAGNGTTDDATHINNALAACPPGGTVTGRPGAVYAIGSPLIIPPQVHLDLGKGSHIDAASGAVIKPLSSFSGAAAILMVDQATGGYSLASNGQTLSNFTIDGSSLTGTTIDGIQAQGFVHGVIIEDVQIRYMPNHGVATVLNSSGVPYSWRLTQVAVFTCTGFGFSPAALTDSTFFDCEAIGNLKAGFNIAGSPSNSHFISCRAEYNGYDGFAVSGSWSTATGAGGCTFTNCSTDGNNQNGFHISATGSAPVTLTGCMLRRDGANGILGGASYAGLRFDGSTIPVTVTGLTVYPGIALSGGVNSPEYGVSITGSSANVTLGSGFAQGAVTAVHDDGTNTNWKRSAEFLTATGGTGSAVYAVPAAGTIYPSGDSSGAADATAVNALAASMTGGGKITLAPGVHYWAAGTIVITTPGIYIDGPGTACTVNVTGTGTGIRMYSTTTYAPAGAFGGGLTGGFVIDGASAGNGSQAFHIGDIYQLEFNVRIRRFQGTGSVGAWFDNNYFWTEQITGKLWVEECTTHVLFDNSANTSGTATGSYDRAVLDIFLDCKNKGNGVVFQNGAFILDGKLGIFGNTDQPAAQCAVLTLTGSNTANGYSLIGKSQLNIGVELNNISSGTQPYTILFGSAGNNTITGCTGVIDFSGNNPFAQTSGFGGSFQFDGPVYGDTHLQRTAGIGAAPYEFGALATGNQIYTRYAGIVRVTTTTSVTGITMSIGATAAQVPQAVTVINSGTGSITFAQSGSNVAGGAANVIAPNSAMTFTWNGDATLWYAVAQPAPATDLAFAPAGANSETFPRQYGSAYFSAVTSEQIYASATKLTAGQVVTSITLEVGGVAWTLANVSHGWYALADSGLVVRGVTADQTSGNWGTTFTTVTLNLGTPYTAPYTGLYYIAFCITYTGSSGEVAALPSPLGGTTSLAPILAGSSGTATTTTPPAAGTTMTALAVGAADRFYAYTS